MMDYYEALARLKAELPPIDELEMVPLAACSGRILAEDMVARYDTPTFDNSAMDGYAVADPEASLTRFVLCGRTAAGDAPGQGLQAGQAQRVFTGAPVPAGTTAVVAQENVRVEDDQLILGRPANLGQHLRLRGEEFVAGTTLLSAGLRLGPASLALAASQGHAELRVHRRLRVAVFSSGNELCPPDAELGPGKIHDANRYQLLGWLALLPVDILDCGILPDNAAITRERIAAAAETCDVILTSGGVSVGEEDHLKSALQSLGQLDAWRLAIKPGKPFAWGRAGRAKVFMLPGNPVATFVTFHMLVAPALRCLMGDAVIDPPSWQARAQFDRDGREVRREFLRAVVTQGEDGLSQARLLTGQGSAMLSACVTANALVEAPPSTTINAGEWVRVYPL